MVVVTPPVLAETFQNAGTRFILDVSRYENGSTAWADPAIYATS